jgi:tetratricopeptide (TPR) repeat protein
MDAEGFRAAIDYYSRAIAEFPNYAPPYSGLAQVYTAMASASVERPSSLMPIAKRAVLEALRLDPALAHAYTSLAWVTVCYDWNWAEGLALAQKAVVLEPNYAFGHYAIGAIYRMLGRISEARVKVEQSLRLDPLSISAHRLLGLALTLEGRFHEAERRLLAARALAPASPELAWMMSTLYITQGRMEDGLRYARECQSDPPAPRNLGILAHALAAAGQEQEAREILRRIEEMSVRAYVDPWTFCRLHTALGENEKAIECLARSFEERSTYALIARVDPLLKPLQTDPRFGELIARLNMPTRPRSRAAKR